MKEGNFQSLKLNQQDKDIFKNQFRQQGLSSLEILLTRLVKIRLNYSKQNSFYFLNALDQYGKCIQITKSAENKIQEVLSKYSKLFGFQQQRILEKQLAQILKMSQNGAILDLKKEYLIGGGNFLGSSNPYEEKQKKEQSLNNWLEDEDKQKRCQYVNDCIKELKEMISQLQQLESNTKTYSYQKIKDLNLAFFENPDCHPYLLEFLELSANRLLIYINEEKLFAQENQKTQFIQLIDDQIQVLQSKQQQEPIQNHIFYFKLIRNIFNISQSIQSQSQNIVKICQTFKQVFAVAYKQEQNALFQLIQKCKNACSVYRQSNKITGIIQYNQNVLQKLHDNLTSVSFSTQASFSSQDFSRKSTNASSTNSSMSMNMNMYMQNSQDFAKQQQDQIQYELELQIRHQCIETKQHFRTQYYALMQIDKLIQVMKSDPQYKIDQNSTYFYIFIRDNEKGIISYSAKQYYFKQLENFCFDRNTLLRYISLSVLISCYELFKLKCPNSPLFQEIFDAIYTRYYFEAQEKVYILVSKKKDLIKEIKNKDSLEKQNQLKAIANQASWIISDQNILKNNQDSESEGDFDSDKNSMSAQCQKGDLDLMRSRIDQIKNTQDLFILSRIAWQNYIKQQKNLFQTVQANAVDQFCLRNPQKPILKFLVDSYFMTREISSLKAYIVEGALGSGKTTLAVQIHKHLIEQIQEQIDQMLSKNKQSQSCIVSYGQQKIIYTPILLKLQNMNLTNEFDLQNLFDSQFQEIIQSIEYKLIIIDGLNEFNYLTLIKIFTNSIKDFKKIFFFITTSSFTQQQQQYKQQNAFVHNDCVDSFLQRLGIQRGQFERDRLDQLKNQQIKQFISTQNVNLDFDKRKHFQNNNQLKYSLVLDEINKTLIESIRRTYDSKLLQNPQILYEAYIINKQLNYKQPQYLINSEKDVHHMYFQAQFYGQLSYFQKIQQQQIVELFKMGYLYFFSLIAGHMQSKKQNFITLETVQNEIINNVSKCLDQMYSQMFQQNIKKEQECFYFLKEYFINQLTNYYNKEIFEQLNILVYQNQKQNTENLTFKQESYFYFFLNQN